MACVPVTPSVVWISLAVELVYLSMTARLGQILVVMCDSPQRTLEDAVYAPREVFFLYQAFNTDEELVSLECSGICMDTKSFRNGGTTSLPYPLVTHYFRTQNRC